MNITLIGMAGAGKSIVGKELAKRLDYRFVDVDKVIEKRNRMRLQQIIDGVGDDKFIKEEERAVLSLGKIKNCIISPGGSVVYSKKAMAFLKNNSKIVFLDTSLKAIEKNITNVNKRGIVGLKNRTLKELFEERLPLYKRYADMVITIDKEFNLDLILKKITKTFSLVS